VETTLTIRVRTIVVSLGVAIALLLAYFVGSLHDSGGTTAAAGDDTTPAASSDTPTIVMTGTGDATGVPDQLAFRVAVEASASDVSSALAQANTTTRRVFNALEANGVAHDNLQTTGLSIHPNYDYSGDGPAVITGYSATEHLSVLVDSIPGSGKALSAAAAAGGNAIRISGIKLQIGDKDALMKKARTAAIDEAMRKAEEYADAAGRELGDAISIREATASQIRRIPVAFASAADGIRSVPIRAGTSPLKVTVAVVWTFA
jgi:uncharacterized protein